MEQSSRLYLPSPAGPSTRAPASSLRSSLSKPECRKHQPTSCATQIRLQRAGKACSHCTERAAHWAANWRILLWNTSSSVENGRERDRRAHAAGLAARPLLPPFQPKSHSNHRGVTSPLALHNPAGRGQEHHPAELIPPPVGPQARSATGTGDAAPAGPGGRTRVAAVSLVPSAGAAFGPRPSPGGWGRRAPAVLRGKPQTLRDCSGQDGTGSARVPDPAGTARPRSSSGAEPSGTPRAVPPKPAGRGASPALTSAHAALERVLAEVDAVHVHMGIAARVDGPDDAVGDAARRAPQQQRQQQHGRQQRRPARTSAHHVALPAPHPPLPAADRGRLTPLPGRDEREPISAPKREY